jgi:hypothetical protein
MDRHRRDHTHLRTTYIIMLYCNRSNELSLRPRPSPPRYLMSTCPSRMLGLPTLASTSCRCGYRPTTARSSAAATPDRPRSLATSMTDSRPSGAQAHVLQPWDKRPSRAARSGYSPSAIAKRSDLATEDGWKNQGSEASETRVWRACTVTLFRRTMRGMPLWRWRSTCTWLCARPGAGWR